MLSEYRENLAALIQDLRRRGTTVVVTGQPHFDSALASDDDRTRFWNGAVGDSATGPATTYYSERVLDTLAWKTNDAARGVAEALGVPYVDLDAVVPCDPRHYYDQFHLTPAGADLVGRAVADVISRAWLQAGSAGASPGPA
jgi:lysophospholipase L1-like esterase